MDLGEASEVGGLDFADVAVIYLAFRQQPRAMRSRKPFAMKGSLSL